MNKNRQPDGAGNEVIPPDNSLAAKVARREGESPEAAFENASVMINGQAIDFIGRVRSDIGEIKQALEIALQDEDRRGAAVERVFGLVHNLKGQGTTFGYPLVSQIGALVCSILRRSQPADEGCVRIVKAHIDALALVIEHNLAGDGGQLGAKLVDRLEQLAASAG